MIKLLLLTSDGHQLKIECFSTLEQGFQQITCIAALNKNGRVFFGGDDGDVKELVF